MTLGDAFYFNHPAAHRHLWVATGGPKEDGFVIFNLTTVRDGCDQTCVLNVGDHPTIDRPTCVSYLRGRELPIDFATSHAHLISQQQPFGRTVLRRIQDGALASPFTIGRFQKIVKASLV